MDPFENLPIAICFLLPQKKKKKERYIYICMYNCTDTTNLACNFGELVIALTLLANREVHQHIAWA